MNEETNLERKTIKGDAQKSQEKENEVQYEAKFELPAEFGKVGAVLVENEHNKEMFLKSIVLDGFPDGPVHVTCDSWVQQSPVKRVFFTDKVSIIKCVILTFIILRKKKIHFFTYKAFFN